MKAERIKKKKKRTEVEELSQVDWTGSTYISMPN